MKFLAHVSSGLLAAMLMLTIFPSAAQQHTPPKTPQQVAAEKDNALKARMAKCTREMQLQGLRAGSDEFNRAMSQCLRG